MSVGDPAQVSEQSADRPLGICEMGMTRPRETERHSISGGSEVSGSDEWPTPGRGSG
jgi:hypothetical protein